MDLISREDAIRWVKTECNPYGKPTLEFESGKKVIEHLEQMPSAQPEIIRCKDCKFYSPMNRETKTGICNLIMHQNFGDNWFCAGAERRTDESNMRDK